MSEIANFSENDPPELRLHRLRIGRVGNQLHVWALQGELDRQSASLTFCHLDAEDGPVIELVAAGDEVMTDAPLVIHTGGRELAVSREAVAGRGDTP